MNSFCSSINWPEDWLNNLQTNKQTNNYFVWLNKQQKQNYNIAIVRNQGLDLLSYFQENFIVKAGSSVAYITIIQQITTTILPAMQVVLQTGPRHFQEQTFR